MSIPELVTMENFAHAETAHYFTEQLARAPVNEYHNREPVTVENQVIIRSNVDLIYSYAVVDVTQEATFSLAPSQEYQIAQIIDENHYVPGVVYPGDTLTVRNSDLTTGTHVYILGRTATTGGLDRAHELQDLRRIQAATSNPYVPPSYDQDSLVAMRKQIESRAAEADYSKGSAPRPRRPRCSIRWPPSWAGAGCRRSMPSTSRPRRPAPAATRGLSRSRRWTMSTAATSRSSRTPTPAGWTSSAPACLTTRSPAPMTARSRSGSATSGARARLTSSRPPKGRSSFTGSACTGPATSRRPAPISRPSASIPSSPAAPDVAPAGLAEEG